MAIENIPGVFEIEIDGVKRDLKVSFGLIERLETRLLKRPLADLLTEAAQSRQYISDVVTVIQAGLEEAGDKRLSREALGAAILKEGPPKFAIAYVDMLVYALTGGRPSDPSAAPADDAKKNLTT
jgi:hypothetical protein